MTFMRTLFDYGISILIEHIKKHFDIQLSFEPILQDPAQKRELKGIYTSLLIIIK